MSIIEFLALLQNVTLQPSTRIHPLFTQLVNHYQQIGSIINDIVGIKWNLKDNDNPYGYIRRKIGCGQVNNQNLQKGLMDVIKMLV